MSCKVLAAAPGVGKIGGPGPFETLGVFSCGSNVFLLASKLYVPQRAVSEFIYFCVGLALNAGL